MKWDLRIAGPAVAQGIIGMLALILAVLAAPEAICGGTMSGGLEWRS